MLELSLLLSSNISVFLAMFQSSCFEQILFIKILWKQICWVSDSDGVGLQTALSGLWGEPGTQARDYSDLLDGHRAG